METEKNKKPFVFKDVVVDFGISDSKEIDITPTTTEYLHGSVDHPITSFEEALKAYKTKTPIITPEDILPKQIESTDGYVYNFEPQRIFDSLIIETGIDPKSANEVTTEILRRMVISNGNDIFPAPFIREIACTVLAEKGMKLARNKYTRLGMPIADVKKVVSEKSFDYSMLWISAHMIVQLMHLNGFSNKVEESIKIINQRVESLEIQDALGILQIIEKGVDRYREREQNVEGNRRKDKASDGPDQTAA